MSYSSTLDGFGIPLMEMAIDREQFKTRVEEKVVGAMREFAFIQIAKANNETRWVQHKETEVERLLNELGDLFDFYSTKGKWDKRKAALEAVAVQEARKLPLYVTKAVNAFERYYGRKPSKKIAVSALTPLLAQIKSIISAA